ncbi:hypothetical protein EW146_g10124 [Bondarzewia mesenterica]|uniref:Uncharacterized protein n=1 Tax=Bondarzewia mesenterica TaxID=1095465 RepID=A0A4S4L0D7_9AGAM|nr:hypothetical protein EW146_g10124 [Bondarzewia mesenterica]
MPGVRTVPSSLASPALGLGLGRDLKQGRGETRGVVSRAETWDKATRGAGEGDPQAQGLAVSSRLSLECPSCGRRATRNKRASLSFESPLIAAAKWTRGVSVGAINQRVDPTRSDRVARAGVGTPGVRTDGLEDGGAEAKFETVGEIRSPDASILQTQRVVISVNYQVAGIAPTQPSDSDAREVSHTRL